MNRSRFNTLGVVLAGGASVRMGQDKASLSWQHVTLMQHAQSLLQTVCDHVIVSGKPQGIADEQPFSGPVAALQSVLNHSLLNAVDRVVVCAVDTPFLVPSDLQSLLKALDAHPAAHYQQHFLPMALQLNAHTRHQIKAVAGETESSQRSMRRLCAAVGAIELMMDDHNRDHFINLNTPELYQQYCRQLDR